MQNVLQEEFKSGLKETESRWTKEGLLDIREEVPQEFREESKEKPVAVEEEDEGVDDDFETILRKHQEKLKAKGHFDV